MMTTATDIVAFVDDDVFVCVTCTWGNEFIRSIIISVASAVVAVIVDYVPMKENLSSLLSC